MSSATLDVGIIIPDTVEEFLALCGNGDEFSCVVYDKKGRELARGPLSLSHRPKYVGEIVRGTATLEVVRGGRPSVFWIFRGPDVLSNNGKFDEGDFYVRAGDTITCENVKVIGV